MARNSMNPMTSSSNPTARSGSLIQPIANPQTQPGHYVYRFDPANGNATVTAVATNLNLPNGLCFSPDETKLFVADTDGADSRL